MWQSCKLLHHTYRNMTKVLTCTSDSLRPLSGSVGLEQHTETLTGADSASFCIQQLKTRHVDNLHAVKVDLVSTSSSSGPRGAAEPRPATQTHRQNWMFPPCFINMSKTDSTELFAVIFLTGFVDWFIMLSFCGFQGVHKLIWVFWFL